MVRPMQSCQCSYANAAVPMQLCQCNVPTQLCQCSYANAVLHQLGNTLLPNKLHTTDHHFEWYGQCCMIVCDQLQTCVCEHCISCTTQCDAAVTHTHARTHAWDVLVTSRHCKSVSPQQRWCKNYTVVFDKIVMASGTGDDWSPMHALVNVQRTHHTIYPDSCLHYSALVPNKLRNTCHRLERSGQAGFAEAFDGSN